MPEYLYILRVIEYWNSEYPSFEIGSTIEDFLDKYTIGIIIKTSFKYNKTVPYCCGRIYDSCFGSGSLTLLE